MIRYNKGINLTHINGGVLLNRIILTINRIKFLSALSLIGLTWSAILFLDAVLWIYRPQVQGMAARAGLAISIALFVIIIGCVTTRILWRYAKEQCISMK